jgi:hypothetical protein
MNTGPQALRAAPEKVACQRYEDQERHSLSLPACGNGAIPRGIAPPRFPRHEKVSAAIDSWTVTIVTICLL